MNVYGNKLGNMDTEDSRPLIGDSPYSDSKIKAEEYLIKWCGRNNVRLGILRPGLLVGSNAPGNLGAMVNGIRKGFYLNIGQGICSGAGERTIALKTADGKQLYGVSQWCRKRDFSRNSLTKSIQ